MIAVALVMVMAVLAEDRLADGRPSVFRQSEARSLARTKLECSRSCRACGQCCSGHCRLVRRRIDQCSRLIKPSAAVANRQAPAPINSAIAWSASLFGSLTWSFVTDEATRRRVDPGPCKRPGSTRDMSAAGSERQMLELCWPCGRRRLPHRAALVSPGDGVEAVTSS